MSLGFTGERIVPGATDCEPTFAQKMYQEHIARYAFAAQFAADADVLDVGCGVGYGSQWLGKMGARSVLGFDISAEAIEHARMNYFHPAVSFKVQDATMIDAQGSFDLVTCFELIEHIEQQEPVLDLIKSALREDGVLAISTPRPLDGIRTHFHVHEMSFEELFGLLKQRFKYVEPFFEINCFTSFIGREQPSAIDRIVPVTDRLSMEHADYFVFLAGDAPLDRKIKVGPVLTLNDDSYILTLEKDTDVLRRAENDHKARIADLEREKHDLSLAHSHAKARAESLSEIQDQTSSIRSTVELINHQVTSQLSQLADANLVRQQNSELSAELAAGSARISELCAEIAQLRSELADRAKQVEVLAADLSARDAQVAEQDEQIAASNARIAEQEEQIAFLLSEQQVVPEVVEALEDRIQSATQEIETVRRLLAEAQHELAETESKSYTAQAQQAAQLEASAREVELLRRDLRESGVQLDSVRRAMAETANQLAASQTEAHALREAAQRLPEILEQSSRFENEANALRYRLERAEATLARFRGSFSWALTSPLRWVWRKYRILTGRSLPQ